MSEALVSARAAAILVPEAGALAMIEAASKRLEHVATLADVMMVVTQADAISAVMQKIKASERARKAALRLRIDAEARLGQITAKIPQAKRGAGAVRGQRTKRQVLTENGIHNYRAGVAERLAKVPAEKIEAAVERAKGSSVYGVIADLGLRKPWRDYQVPEITSRALVYLATEAIELLERAVDANTAPHAGTVAELRNRLTRLVPPKR